MKKSYKIDVDCANCANKMEAAANNTPGVKSAIVSFMTMKMKVEFEDDAPFNSENVNKLARIVHGYCADEELPHLDKNAMARIVEYSSRLAGNHSKLSTRFNEIIQIIGEAGTWARLDRVKVVTEDYITKALNEKGIYLQNRVKEELHITKTFVGNEKEKITFTNYDLGKINEVKISKYGELIKENVKLESGEIRKSVLANHGILVESINNEKVSNNTHITLANNNDKMIVNINGKDKKVRIGAPVETKDCNFNVEFDITLQGKNAVFDNESKAFFKFEDKDKLIDKALKEEIEKKAENILNNEKEVEKIETISL